METGLYRQYCCVLCNAEILKQRRAAQTAIDRPNTEALKKAREVRLKQVEMNAIIKECIVYLLFVLVVYFISYQERDRRSFLFAQNIKNQFFGSKPYFSSVSFHIFTASLSYSRLLLLYILFLFPSFSLTSYLLLLLLCWYLLLFTYLLLAVN